MAGNPPSSRLVTVRYGQLQSLGQGGLTTQGAPALNTIDYKAKLPTSTQFSGGIQMAMPWAMTLDVEWVGQHSYNTVRTVNINAVDLGSAFLAQNQNPNLVERDAGRRRAVERRRCVRIRGYAAINMRQFNGWRTFHSLQTSIQRRFRNGVSFGFNDTWVLYDHAERRAASPARRGRLVLRAAPTRRRPTNCSATSSPASTSSRGTSCGTCPTSGRTARR